MDYLSTLRLPIGCGCFLISLMWGTNTAKNSTNAQEVDPRRPAAIQTADVPAVPQELYAKLAQYQNTRAAVFRGWAPDGTGMLIGTRFGNAAQLHRVYEAGGRREQVTFFDEPVSGDFVPGRGTKSGGESLWLFASAGGSENDQVFLLDRNTFSLSRLTDGKSKYHLGPRLHDGSKAIISGNQRNGRDVDMYVVEAKAASSWRMLFQVDKQTWYPRDWSRDGKTLLIYRYVSANEAYPALLDVESGNRTDLKLPSNEKAGLGPMAFSPDKKYVYIATDAGGEFRRLARLDLATSNYEWLSADLDWDVSDLAVEPATGDVIFAINEDGASRLFHIPGGDPKKRKELKLPLGIVTGLEFSPDGKQLGFTLSLPTAPSEAYSFSLSTGQLTRWTFSEVGGLNPEKFVAPQRIRFKSFDGRMIPAYYFAPRDATSAQKAAVYVNIHGGPESQFQPFFNSITQFYVNELGLAVIHPNVRGSNGYGKTYLQLDNAERREDSVKDIGALLDWIGQQPELDSKRVAVAGGSYGGYMVLASLTHFGNRLKAGIDYVGIANFITFLERTAAYRVDLRRAEYGDERDPKMREVFQRISPLNNADKIQAALMVVHGKNDPRVPFFEAEQIAAKVRGQGKAVWTIFADNEGHGFAKKDNNDYARAVEVLFLRHHLGLQ